MPLELEGRVAWKNPGAGRKETLLEGAGIQFLNFDEKSRIDLPTTSTSW